MKKTLLWALAVGLLSAGTSIRQTVRVGGQAMFPTKNIIENAVNSADHTTLVAAVKAAGLVATLQGPGPFTVFAPVNWAFNELPAGTVDSLLKPESKDKLTAVLTYHVVPGWLSFGEIERQIRQYNGRVAYKTIQGGTLTFQKNGDNILIEDSKGGVANLTISNVYQSNGVIHVIDRVLMP
jgi:uncharacterized surface protein with fasciclin (FAS1) repeats